MRAPEFWNQKHGRGAAPLTRALLTPFGWLYLAVSKWRYDRHVPEQMPVPVICVGNITLGGTGKTPLAIAIARYLQANGKSPAFVSRGHGGKRRGPLQVDPQTHSFEDVGDEPLLLAKTTATFIGRDRVAAAHLAVQSGAGCLIMDDGFQNPSLKKDLSILTIDAAIGHGNGRVFPAGPLRETVAGALKRADAVVLIGDGDTPDLAGFTGLIFRAGLQAKNSAPAGKLVAFAGIGRPEKFFDSLRDAGADIAQEIAFADHHPYQNKDVQNLLQWAKHNQAKLITTEKDMMRWPQKWRKELLIWPVELKFANARSLPDLLQGVIAKCQ